MDTKEIFISYRRVPCVDFARTIHYALSKYGIDSFFDYTSCRDGHFNENIFHAIDQSQYIFLIIMNGSLDGMWDNPEDWVRKELEYAVEHNKTIVPIVKNGNSRQWPDKLPPKLENLRNIQISKIDDEELFEISLKDVLQCRTNLLNKTSELNNIQANKNNIKQKRMNLSKFITTGFNLTSFAVRFLRGQCDASELNELKYSLEGETIPFPGADHLSSENMIEYFFKCGNIVSDIYGEEARYALEFGIIFHLSDIAKRSNLGEDFAHSYDKSLIVAGRSLRLDDELLGKIINSNGNNMMDYYQAVKICVDK